MNEHKYSDAKPGASFNFSGKSAVVTGGANGIGAACAAFLRQGGATTLIFDVEAKSDGLRVDLADRAAVENAADEALNILGHIDILVNVAGIFHANPMIGINLKSHDQIIAVNLTAPIILMSKFAEVMAKNGYGRIVNITSIQARLSEAHALSYGVTKAGLESATRTAALELADSGVLVNAVAPGFVATRMSIIDGEDELEGELFTDVYVAQGRLPLRRAAQPFEIAQGVAFLASDRNTYITGQVLTIDGGLSSRF